MIEELAPNGKSPPAAVDRKNHSVRAPGEQEPSFREVLERKQKQAAAGEGESASPQPTAAKPAEPASTPAVAPEPPVDAEPSAEEEDREDASAEASPDADAGVAIPLPQTPPAVVVPVPVTQDGVPGTEMPGAEDSQAQCPAGAVVLTPAGTAVACPPLEGEAAGQELPAGSLPAGSLPAGALPPAGQDVEGLAPETAPFTAALNAVETAAAQSTVETAAALNTVDVAEGAAPQGAAPTQALYTAPQAPASSQFSNARALAPEPSAEPVRMMMEEPTQRAESQRAETKIDPAQAHSASNSARPDVQAAGVREPVRSAEASSELFQQVARNIELAVNQNQTTMHVRLNPHELGSIDIRLISNQNGIGIMVLAEKAATGRLIESQLGQLQQSIASAGVELTQLFVGQNSPQDPQANLFTNLRQEHGGHRQSPAAPEQRRAAEQAGQQRKEAKYSIIDYRV